MLGRYTTGPGRGSYPRERRRARSEVVSRNITFRHEDDAADVIAASACPGNKVTAAADERDAFNVRGQDGEDERVHCPVLQFRQGDDGSLEFELPSLNIWSIAGIE